MGSADRRAANSRHDRMDVTPSMHGDPHLSEWVAKIETRLQVNPHDAEGWFALSRDAQTRPIEQMRQFWERAVSHFPTHPYFWMLYIEQEIKANHHEEAERLFARCLHKIPAIDLSRQHVKYVIMTKPPMSAQNREKISEAYAQAVDRVGLDIEASSLYLDYVRFLTDCEAVGTYAEQQRGLAIRKVFQQAIAVPLTNIEMMWKEYCHFEQEFQPHLAEKITAERSREYTTAKKNSKILEPLIRSLRRDKLPSPPRTLEEERHQIDSWRKWINFERSNPLMLDDANKATKRIAYVFENCLMCMPYRIDMWLETAAHYREAADKALARSDQATAREVLNAATLCIERGITLYPDRALFYLVIADLEEYRKNYKGVKKVFERCLEKIKDNPTLPYIHYMLYSRRAEGIQAARLIFKRARDDVRTTQEIFIASALMEFFVTKDKQIALNIFELGMKRYSVSAQYAKIYLDFLMLQNEYNNAKILVEKASTLESLSTQDKLLIAGTSQDYETLLGDYDSIQRTEKSRSDLMNQLQLPASTSAIASRMVSRWNYMDLTPLNDNDLVNMDYIESRKAISLITPSTFSLFKTKTTVKKAGSASGVVMPDISAMVPFKPRPNNRGHLAVKGGDYAFPEALESLKRFLPPPESFAGPFPDLDQVIQLLLEESPKSGLELQKANEGIDSGIKAIAEVVEMANDAEHEKIKAEADPEKRFHNDIYRLRLAKKMKIEND